MNTQKNWKVAAEPVDDAGALLKDIKPMLGKIQALQKQAAQFKQAYGRDVWMKHAPFGLSVKNGRMLAATFRAAWEQIEAAKLAIDNAEGELTGVIAELEKR